MAMLDRRFCWLAAFAMANIGCFVLRTPETPPASCDEFDDAEPVAPGATDSIPIDFVHGAQGNDYPTLEETDGQIPLYFGAQGGEHLELAYVTEYDGQLANCVIRMEMTDTETGVSYADGEDLGWAGAWATVDGRRFLSTRLVLNHASPDTVIGREVQIDSELEWCSGGFTPSTTTVVATVVDSGEFTYSPPEADAGF